MCSPRTRKSIVSLSWSSDRDTIYKSEDILGVSVGSEPRFQDAANCKNIGDVLISRETCRSGGGYRNAAGRLPRRHESFMRSLPSSLSLARDGCTFTFADVMCLSQRSSPSWISRAVPLARGPALLPPRLPTIINISFSRKPLLHARRRIVRFT